MPLDNLTDLLVFIRVADACSFTLAAERLGISRSAAGKCVNRLEERLATRLLQRTTRSVSLTEDGAVFTSMRSASCRRPKRRKRR